MKRPGSPGPRFLKAVVRNYSSSFRYVLLYQEGHLVSDADILIAATALKHHLVMVTENVNHVRRILGLSIEDWRA